MRRYYGASLTSKSFDAARPLASGQHSHISDIAILKRMFSSELQEAKVGRYTHITKNWEESFRCSTRKLKCVEC